jgi:hypothetical protein
VLIRIEVVEWMLSEWKLAMVDARMRMTKDRTRFPP